MNTQLTLGRLIADCRGARKLSLRNLGQLVLKEDGHAITPQYLHDIEQDRRVPSSQVLKSLAEALAVDEHYLAAVAGKCPTEVTDYLRERPDCAPAVAALFARAHAAGFVDWESVANNPPKTAAIAGNNGF